jgi:hypothetical protein
LSGDKLLTITKTVPSSILPRVRVQTFLLSDCSLRLCQSERFENMKHAASPLPTANLISRSFILRRSSYADHIASNGEIPAE